MHNMHTNTHSSSLEHRDTPTKPSPLLAAFGDAIAATIGDMRYAPSAPPPPYEDDNASAFDATKPSDDKAKATGDKDKTFTSAASGVAHADPNRYANMNEEDAAAYQEWLRARQLSERRAFSKHEEWHRDLRQTASGETPSFRPCINKEDLPPDVLSASFRAKVLSAHAAVHGNGGGNNAAADAGFDESHRAFVDGIAPPSLFSSFHEYVPRSFAARCMRGTALAKMSRPQGAHDEDDDDDGGDGKGPVFHGNRFKDAWTHVGDAERNAIEQSWNAARTESFDEVKQMISASDARYDVSWLNPMKQVVPTDKMWIVSNHNGGSTGTRFEIWGAGNKPRFLSGRKNRVSETRDMDVETNAPYVYVPGRFTITYILPNEVGFVVDRLDGRIKIMRPGRYFVHEMLDNFIGKASVTLGTCTRVKVHDKCKLASVKEFAKRIEVVSIAAGHSAFVMSGNGVFVAPYRQQPWIVDIARDEKFLSMLRTGDRTSHVAAATDAGT
jgi:hypothetical protein